MVQVPSRLPLNVSYNNGLRRNVHPFATRVTSGCNWTVSLTTVAPVRCRTCAGEKWKGNPTYSPRRNLEGDSINLWVPTAGGIRSSLIFFFTQNSDTENPQSYDVNFNQARHFFHKTDQEISALASKSIFLELVYPLPRYHFFLPIAYSN